MARAARQRRFGLLVRLLAMTACMVMLVVGLMSLWAGMNLYLGALLLASATAVVVPAAVVGAEDGILGVIVGLLELVAEAISTLVEAILSLFSG